MDRYVLQTHHSLLLCPERLILLGHSAGGCLALWAAQRWSGTAGAVAPLVLAAAPVADLEMKVSDEGDAVELYMKQPPTSESALEAYRLASPAANLPVSFPLLIVYGDADADVPPELVKAYAHAARAGAPALVSVLEISQADHFQVVDATSDAWRQARRTGGQMRLGRREVRLDGGCFGGERK
ncbi:Hypothetical protein (Fragment) [Durusdinium trenchii]|uniref:Peptidase S9 prolyl oligopeptidase catalytic domain-containing protein n=1 Tax=Durusdinium trenchii TaxID=1381693 RepID=A0ABP0MZP7_9DINO